MTDSSAANVPAAPAETRGRLARIVDECLQAAAALEAELRDERQALERQDDEALNAAAAAKRDSVHRLERLEGERQAACREAGRPAALDQMTELLAWCGADERLLTGWRRFLDGIAACERRNTANGAAILLRQRQLAAALDILRGSPAEPAETYGPRGNTGSGRSRRALASI